MIASAYAGDLKPDKAWRPLRPDSGGLSRHGVEVPVSRHDGAVAQGRTVESLIIFHSCAGRHSRVTAARAGYCEAFSVAGGFEGGPEDSAQRGKCNGWEAVGLAWRKS